MGVLVGTFVGVLVGLLGTPVQVFHERNFSLALGKAGFWERTPFRLLHA